MAYLARLLDADEPSDSAAGCIAPGDVVRRGTNLYPSYRVIAVNHGKAWVRDVQFGSDYVVHLHEMRKI